MNKADQADWSIPPKLWPHAAVALVLAAVVLWKFLQTFNPLP